MIGEEQGHFWEKEILRIFIILVTTGFSRKVCSGFQLWKNEVFGQSNTGHIHLSKSSGLYTVKEMHINDVIAS